MLPITQKKSIKRHNTHPSVLSSPISNKYPCSFSPFLLLPSRASDGSHTIRIKAVLYSSMFIFNLSLRQQADPQSLSLSFCPCLSLSQAHSYIQAIFPQCAHPALVVLLCATAAAFHRASRAHSPIEKARTQ